MSAAPSPSRLRSYDAHRERVHDSADRVLNNHADLLQRLKDEDNGDDGDAMGDV